MNWLRFARKRRPQRASAGFAMRTIERAQAEIDRGRLWRAKDILEGSIANVGYNLELYEAYGVLLLQMGDLPKAGQFLFLSGARSPHYHEAIRIYLGRYKSPSHLYSSFPRGARLIDISTYPPQVESDLRAFGFPTNVSLFRANANKRTMPVDESAGLRTLPSIVLGLFVLVLLLFLILGFIKFKELGGRLF